MNVVSIKNKNVLFLLNISSDFLKERVRIQSSFFYNSFISHIYKKNIFYEKIYNYRRRKEKNIIII
jgi:hypothetical protein